MRSRTKRMACAIAALAGACMAQTALGQAESCADAGSHPVTVGVPFGGNFTGSTNDGPTSCGSTSNLTQWWTFTAPATARYTISMCSSAQGDTHLGVTLASAACSGTVTYIACNDDACGLGSQVVVDLTMGVTYRLRTATFSGVTNGGGYTVLITQASGVAPMNNDCGMATVATLGSNFGNNNGATGTNDNSCGGTLDTNDVYFSFTAPSAGLFRFSTCATDFDTVMSVHTACPATSGNQVTSGCLESAGAPIALCSNRGSSVVASLTSGQTVFVRVAGTTGQTVSGTPGSSVPQAGFGQFELAISQVPPPANDDCSNAVVLDLSSGGSEFVDATGAVDDDDIDCNGASPVAVAGVWYTFTTGPSSGVLNVNETGSATVATQLYTGSCGSLSTVASSCSTTQNRNFSLQANTTYYMIMAMSAATRPTVPYSFTYQFLQAPDNDLCENAELIDVVSGGSVSSNAPSATDDQDVSCNSGTVSTRHGVWYTFTPSQTGIVSFAETSTADTVHALFTGSCGSLLELSCSDPESSTAFVQAGTTYRLLVGMWSSTTVPTVPYGLTFSFSPAPPAPTNDECSGAVVLDLVNGGSELVDAQGALNDADIDCNGTSPFAVAGVWYTFTTGASPGVVNINESSTASVATQLYTGDCNSLSPVFGSCSTTQNRNFGVQANTTYYMLMSMSAAVRPTVPYSFTYQFLQAPDNDLCENAEVIDVVAGGSVSANGQSASDETIDVTCNSGTIARAGVWYVFTTQYGGTVTVAETSPADTFHAVFTGGCGGLTQVHCSDPETSSFTVQGGQTYYLLVGMWGTTTFPSAPYGVNYSFVPAIGACCNGDVCSTQTEADCISGGGTYVGDGLSCADLPGYVSPDAAVPTTDGSSTIGAPPGVTTMTITTTDTTSITSIDFVVDLVHTWAGDTTARITAPDGTTTATLWERPGRSPAGDCTANGTPFGNSNDFNGRYSISDSGTIGSHAAIAAGPAAGISNAQVWQANSCGDALVNLNSIFGGLSVAGTWTLTIEDRATGDTGTLRGFGMTVNGVTVPVCDSGPAPCPGNFNGDGTVDLLDLLAFNAAWSGSLGQNVTPGTGADLNNDGIVDLLDLLAFNAAWSSNLGNNCP